MGPLVFDCRGLAARDAAPDLRGVKGEMVVLRCTDVGLTRPVRLLHPRHPLYIVPRGDGVHARRHDDRGDRAQPHHRPRPAGDAERRLRAAPAFAEAEVLEIGVDARPAFPDNLPRIRRRGARILVNGLYRHGFLLAPALARMAADLALDGVRPEVMDEDHAER